MAYCVCALRVMHAPNLLCMYCCFWVPCRSLNLYMYVYNVHVCVACVHQCFIVSCLLQCSLEELTLDAQHVSYLVCSDPEFQGLLTNITPQGVVRGVADAMQKLHKAPSPQGGNVPNVGLSPEGCMMVALGVQWLVRHLCKRLMQLMTPEALTVHRMKMDSSYLVNYLRHHSHFSLKVLIKDRLATLKHTTV